ncbi:hypothetical protein TRFO_33137 [Tritrichomonas foetus]|uniref:Uncharacterized protein n=1 Tax=Tritrichomonas foetus TaxID=1144522 RepID=A0A1J4JRR4_9EUKA|nr:hypothetical protein TRFO_33137 [Tritrichomonas foetus]|eukprot:OHT00222.1 hypothetical protein TRFO_33137 [Tritrichomonas foetus]
MLNRPPQSVLSQHPRIKSPKKSKASKYFQNASKPPTISHLPTTAPGARTNKPLVNDVTFNPDDPFYKIEETANRIEKIVSSYETEKEEEHQKMLQELDSNYLINSYEPDQILKDSKKVVDNLINRNTELKDSQTDMLGSIYSWLHKEEKILSSQTDSDKPDFSVPTATSDDILNILNSSEGSNQQRISKAMILHSDMMSKALLALNHLEAQNAEQSKLIKDLQNQIQSQKKKTKRVSKPPPQNAELQKMLQQSESRISAQDDTIKRLNQRIEQLIAQTVNNSARSRSSVSEDEFLTLQHENYQNKIQIQQLELDNQGLKDEIFKRKYKQMTLEAEKDFLETQNLSLQELLEVEKAKVDSITRDFLNRINGQMTDNIYLEQITALKMEINKITHEKDTIKEQMHDEMIKKLNSTRKEFEIRELEIKKRAITQSIAGSHQEVIEELQKQHEDEINHIKNDYEDQIASIKRSNAEQIKQNELATQQKIKEMQDQMNKVVASTGGKETQDILTQLQKQFNDQEIEMKTQYAAKIEMLRTEFMRKQKKLEDELLNREKEIDKMLKLFANAEVVDSRNISRPISARNKNDEDNAEIGNDDDISNQTKIQIDNAISQYGKKLEAKYKRKLNEQKEKLDEEWKSKLDDISNKFDQANNRFIDTIESLNLQITNLQTENDHLKNNDEKYEDLRTQITNLETRNSELESLNKQLEDENANLQKIIDQKDLDSSFTDLYKTFTEQTDELNQIKEKFEETKKLYNDLRELKKENLPTLPKSKSKLDISDSMIVTKFILPTIFTKSQVSNLFIHPSNDQSSINGTSSKICSLVFEEIKSQFIPLNKDSLPANINVSCQADFIHLPKIIHTSLTSQPPIEIFAVRNYELRPEIPIALEPSEYNTSSKDHKSSNKPNQLLTKQGELVSIPPINHVTVETHPAAASIAAQLAISETRELSNKLQMFASEIQTIEGEIDEKKKKEMRQSLGVSIEIQKDGVISQMRERITELEQMVNRLNSETQLESDAWQIATQTDENILMFIDNDSKIPNQTQSETPCKAATSTKKVTFGVNSKQQTRSQEQQNSQEVLNVEQHSRLSQFQLFDHEIDSNVDADGYTRESTPPPEHSNKFEQISHHSLSNRTSVSFQTENLSNPSNDQKNQLIIQSTETGFSSRGSTPISIIRREGKLPNLGLFTAAATEIFQAEKSPHRVTKASSNTASVASTQTLVSISPTSTRPSSPAPTQVVLNNEPKSSLSIQLSGEIASTNVSDINKSDESNNEHKISQKQKLLSLSINNESIFEVKVPTRTKIDVSSAPKAVVRRSPPMPQLQTKQNEISKLKSSLMKLQNSDTSPEESAKVLANVQSVLDNLNQSLQNSTEPTVLLNLDSISNSDNQDENEDKTAHLRGAIERTNLISKQLFDKANNATEVQTDLIHRMNRAAADFLHNIDNHEQASNEEQSYFLRSVNTATAEFGSTVADIKAEVLNQESLSEAFKTAQDELHKQEEYIKQLRDENFNLRVKNDAPRITCQIRQVQKELNNLNNGNAKENQLFSKYDDASRVIASLISRAHHDNVVAAAKASPLVEKITKEVYKSRPDWKVVTDLINGLTSILENENTWRRSESLIRDVYEQNDQLVTNLTKLRTEKAIAERDLKVAMAKNENELEHIKQSLALAIQQNEVLEKQLKATEILAKSQSSVGRQEFDKVKQELQESQEVERQRVFEINKMTEEKSSLEKENEELQQRLADLQNRYESLFSQATDTQTANQVLESRTNEILRRSEVDAAKARALEKLNHDSTISLDNMAEQLARATEENENLGKKLIEAEDKINELESNKIIELSTSLSSNNSNSASNMSSTNNISLGNEEKVPRIVKMYQQKTEMFKLQLQQRGTEIIAMKARRAEDARSLIMLRREIQRGKSNVRMQQLRYDSAKAESELNKRVIADRDETIRQLKREIERLRQMLAFQKPTKQQLLQSQRIINNNHQQLTNATTTMQRYQRQAAKFSSNATVSKYFDNLMQRQSERLARLEKKRKEIAENEENTKILALQALSHVVRRDELEIPEDVIMQIMPKPAPVQRLKTLKYQQARQQKINQQEKDRMGNILSSARSAQVDLIFDDASKSGSTIPSAPHYKSLSYADTLQQIGQLAGKVPPDVLHEMLRNASRGNVKLPDAPINVKPKKGKGKPTIAGISITPIGRPK